MRTTPTFLHFHFVILALVASTSPLDYRFVCDSHYECVDEMAQLVKMCEDKKVEQKCAQKMSADLEAISQLEEKLRTDSRRCVGSVLEESNQTFIKSVDKNRFCAGYLFNRSATDGDCSLRIARLSNRCEALRRCCDPAVRCEQTVMYSESGRTLSGLKEEVDIKMAECAQHEEETRPHRAPVASPKKLRKVRIIESPPFSLCLKYLQCQKDAHKMRVDCSKSSNPHSVDGLDTDDVSSSTWQSCRVNLEEDFRMMNQRRDEAFSYLDKCVPVANVTREFMITDRVCRASALKERKPRKEVNCHLEVARKRKECALLRDCCVQADVCERSALYAVISDEYLLRRTQLRETLDVCMNRELDERNSVRR